ncbi:IS200/IS605 family accessory protein TnpB-related protein [Streptomyces sp. NPDC056367]|uniref:IS200/IS605 family accessory protein TnpB-related protein n=1 Tax=Streptomyces sp. NPDC056367 TaxID=3345797 RepID=UPI0035DA0C37
MAEKKRQLRKIDDPFVALGPSGVAIRDRLKRLTPQDDKVLRLVGEHLGRLASLDLKARCADGLDHNSDSWAARKQGLTGVSSSRWAGAITKATHDQWALSRRCQLAHLQGLEAGVRTLTHRLSQPIGEKGTKQAPGGYRSKGEWFHKSRRLAVLEHRLDVARVERKAGAVHVVRGGRKLLGTRHNLDAAQLTEAEWRERWDAERWYLTASWTIPPVKTIPLETARAAGMVGVDTNADHFAAYHLDRHGNPVGDPKRFFYDLSGASDHRDAQIRHAISQLLHWTRRCGVRAIGLENLDFTAEKTREKHGRNKRFRKLISGIPTGKLKARLVSMAAEQGPAIIAVDPAYTSMWGDEHWRKPLTSSKRKMSRHDAAGIVIGRRALGHPIRRRTAPPPAHQSDVQGHRTAQAGPGTREREETRPRIPGPRTRCASPDAERTRETRTPKTVRDVPDAQVWVEDSLLLTD